MDNNIVYNSWGWEQTNVDFYEIVRRTAKFVFLRKLKSTIESCGNQSMSGYAMPVLGEYENDVIEKHGIKDYSWGQCIKFKYGCGSFWDGKPKFTSWYG